MSDKDDSLLKLIRWWAAGCRKARTELEETQGHLEEADAQLRDCVRAALQSGHGEEWVAVVAGLSLEQVREIHATGGGPVSLPEVNPDWAERQPPIRDGR